MSVNSEHDNFVERVRSASDIIAVISSYVPLKRKGNRYWGCCPFHNEKTPSFSVVPEEGFFYCFGCHAGGNLFKFISMIENISYYDAIKLQAQRLNIPIPTQRQSAQEQELDNQRKSLLKIHELACTFFHNCLTKTGLGEAGRRYWQSRAIDSRIIEKFKLGYAPNLWDKLYQSFTARNIDSELLLQSGLVNQKDTSKIYDRFRNRVIIPIADEYGRICGFGGRIINPKDNPKYLNSPETLIFNKRKLLFGLDQAKTAIKAHKAAIVVEGYMDAIALHSHGIDNAVASLGTAFTAEQCRKLLRFTPNIYFCYDSDQAGQAATLRALTLASKLGANVHVISIPDGKDPDEFLSKHAPEEFAKLVNKALPLVEYQLQHVLKTTEYTSLQGKLEAVKQLLPVLMAIDNAVEQNAYIMRIANVLGIDESGIRSDLHQYARQNSGLPTTTALPGSNSRKLQQTRDDATTRAGRILIKAAWNDTDILMYILSIVPSEGFALKEHQAILQYMQTRLQQRLPLSDTVAAETLSEEAYSELSHILVEDLPLEHEQMFEDCLHTLQIHHLTVQYDTHRLLADQLQRQGDANFLEELKLSQQIRAQLDQLQQN